MQCVAILKMSWPNQAHKRESLDFSKKFVVLGPFLHLLISKPNWEVIACATTWQVTDYWFLHLWGAPSKLFHRVYESPFPVFFFCLSLSRFHFFQCLKSVFSLTRNSFNPTLFQQLGSWSSFISHNFCFLEH